MHNQMMEERGMADMDTKCANTLSPTGNALDTINRLDNQAEKLLAIMNERLAAVMMDPEPQCGEQVQKSIRENLPPFFTELRSVSDSLQVKLERLHQTIDRVRL